MDTLISFLFLFIIGTIAIFGLAIGLSKLMDYIYYKKTGAKL